jgi:hypothetical protein
MAELTPTPHDANTARNEYINVMQTSAAALAAITELMGRAQQKVIDTWQSPPVQDALQAGWDRHNSAKEQAQQWMASQEIPLPGLEPVSDNIPLLETPNNAVNVASLAGNAARATLAQGKETVVQGATKLQEASQAATEQIKARDLGAVFSKLQGALNEGSVSDALKEVTATLRVNGQNVFSGTLAGGSKLPELSPEQSTAIVKAVEAPLDVMDSVKLLIDNKPALILAAGEVVKDDLKLLPPAKIPSVIQTQAEPQQQTSSFEEQLLDKLEALTNEVKDLKASNVGLQDRISTLEGQLTSTRNVVGHVNQANQAAEQRLSARISALESSQNQQVTASANRVPSISPQDWAKQTFSNIRSKVAERLQSFKSAINGKLSERYLQVSTKLDMAVNSVKQKSEQLQSNARQTFMKNIGEPALQAFIRQEGSSFGDFHTAQTENYSYTFNSNSGSIIMTAKDGRGELSPENMTKQDLAEVSSIAKGMGKLDPPEQQHSQSTKLSM